MKTWKQRARALATWSFWKMILKDILLTLIRAWGPRREGYWVWSERWQAWEFREFPKNPQLPPHR